MTEAEIKKFLRMVAGIPNHEKGNVIEMVEVKPNYFERKK